jgi:signal recognition particle subunit SRP19
VPEHFYVYPSYLKKKASRSAGRRVPDAVAVGEVTPEEIVAAAKALGFEATAEPARHYPREAHLFEGRVRVAKKGPVAKTAFLRQLAERIRTTPRPEGAR